MKNGLLDAPPFKDHRGCVLVVDDDESVRAVCAEMLSRAGFAVSEAENGEQALTELRSVHYHLVITDYHMPKVSGTELARQMRVAGMTQPVILISGTMDIEDQISDSGHLIDTVLPKPFSFDELLSRVNAVLDLVPRATLRSRTFKSP